MKREILIIIITIIITIGVMRAFLPKLNNIDYEPIQPTKITSVGTFETIDCKDCSVLRITESTWSGFIKAGPDKVWEILAKPGAKTSSADWSLEILSVSAENLKVKFSGKIYQGLEPVVNPVVLEGWSKNEEFSDGRVGGGTIWEFVYFQKTD